MMDKKGMDMSIQTMVVAALALIILVVLIVLFTRQSGNFSDSLNSCEERGQGYECVSEGSGCPSDKAFYSNSGCGENQICCAPSNLGAGAG